jgi:cytochrome c-type biogenesis protein CcmH/NrfG
MPPPPSSSARVSAWEWAQAGLLLANLGWTTFCLGGVLAHTMVVTAALNGLLLAVHCGARLAGKAQAHPAGKWLLPFLVYALWNVLWHAPVRWLGWEDWLKWAQMIAVFWVVLNGIRSRPGRTVLLLGLLAIAVAGVALECYQRFAHRDWLMLGRTQAEQFLNRSSGPFGIPNSMAAFLLLLLPATVALALRHGIAAWERIVFGAGAAIFVLGLVLTFSRGGWFALVVVLIAWPLLATGQRWLWRLLATVMTAGVIGALGLALYSIVPMVRIRMDVLVSSHGERSRPIMWRGAWGIFREHPAVGGGAGGYNVLFEKYRPEDFPDNPEWAHNDYLNTLCDYGLVGLILLLGAGGVLAWRCLSGQASADSGRRRSIDDPFVIQGLTVGLLAFALHLFVDFHLKIPALAMTAATTAALIVRRSWRIPRKEPMTAPALGKRLCDGVLLIGAAVVTLGLAVPHYRAEALRYAWRREIDRSARQPIPQDAERSLLAEGRAVLERATKIDPGNAQAWADRAYAVELWTHHDEPAQRPELGREAEIYARRAVALGPLVPEYWIRLGGALDLQHRWVEGGDAFTKALRLAPSLSETWYYQAYHFSLDPLYKLVARAAVATSLRLDPGNRQAEALRQRLGDSR